MTLLMLLRPHSLVAQVKGFSIVTDVLARNSTASDALARSSSARDSIAGGSKASNA